MEKNMILVNVDVDGRESSAFEGVPRARDFDVILVVRGVTHRGEISLVPGIQLSSLSEWVSPSLCRALNDLKAHQLAEVVRLLRSVESGTVQL